MKSNMIVGYTAGAFDLFHIGHLNILKRAKEKCDYLIVAVSTDELILSYKNKHPIFSFDERVSIIESIRYVDLVVPQSDLNKVSAWEKYNFNRLFVGDDWKNTISWTNYERQLSQNGVEILYLPRTKGISSSSLRNKIIDL